MVRCWFDDLVFYKGDIGEDFLDGFFDFVKTLLKTAGSKEYYLTVKVDDDSESMCLEYTKNGYIWGVLGERETAEVLDESDIVPVLMDYVKNGYEPMSIAKGLGF